MANLSETVQWEPNIYQLETTDPVVGGADGISNTQAKQLGNRTAFLKQEVDLRAPIADPTFTGTPSAPTAAPGTNTTQLATTAHVKAAIDALIGGAPGALDTLNELAAAVDDDEAFAATVVNALALKAPLASPIFTGTPGAPTAAPGTDTTQLATTAFVQAEIAGLAWLERVALSASTTLDAAHLNKLVDVNTTSSAMTITTRGPGAGGTDDNEGAYFVIRNAGANLLTLTTPSSSFLLPNGQSVTSIVLPRRGSSIAVRSDGASYAVLWQTGVDVRFQAHQATPLSVPSNTFTKMTFNTETEDLDDSYDTTLNRFVCKMPGRHLFVAAMKFAGSADAKQLTIESFLNGSTSRRGVHQVIGYAGPASVTVVDEINLDVGDYVEMFGWHDASISLSTQESSPLSYFFGRRVD